MSKGYRTIKLKKKQHTTWIILDRPDKLNAINEVMLDELSEAIDRLEEDPEVRCIVISGDGEHVFSAGGDLVEVRRLTPEMAAELSVKGQQVFGKLEEMSKPVVAAISGYALGGGLELALACDFRIAADNTELACPETKFGLIPAWGGTQRLPLAVGASEAKRMIMLGDRIQADEALKIGLVDKVVPHMELEKEVDTLAHQLWNCSLETLKKVKRSVNSVTKVSPDGLKRETDSFVRLFSAKETKEKLKGFGSQRNKK